jgi:hypothetical protein
MQPFRSRRIWVVAVPLAAAVATAAIVILISGGGDGAEDTNTDATARSDELPPSFQEGDEGNGGARDAAPAGANEEEAVVRAARDYLDGIDARDGGRVCERLAPGAIQSFQLPRERGGCAASLRASIGYRDPRGFPVFGSARLDSIGDVSLGEGEARVTATVVTEFADRDQPSIEEDVIYLVQVEGEWLIAKPSSTLYRAVGKPEVPPEAIAPPTE